MKNEERFDLILPSEPSAEGVELTQDVSVESLHILSQKEIGSLQSKEEPLTGIEGLNLLVTSTSGVEGPRLIDVLNTPEGQEMMKAKKIVLAGPPRSGKSCAREGLKKAINGMPGAPYPYVLTACPDGEGSWFQETMNADPAMAARLKAEYKSKFTPEFARRIGDSVHNLYLPLSFIDIGGVISPENEIICEDANGVILIAGESAVKNGIPAQWKSFFSGLGIPLIAEIYSDYKGENDCVMGVGEDGVYRASVHHLERGEMLADREAVKGLAQFVVGLGMEPGQSMPETSREA